jgi:hypothetical protein
MIRVTLEIHYIGPSTTMVISQLVVQAKKKPIKNNAISNVFYYLLFV